MYCHLCQSHIIDGRIIGEVPYCNSCLDKYQNICDITKLVRPPKINDAREVEYVPFSSNDRDDGSDSYLRCKPPHDFLDNGEYHNY